MQKSEKQMRFNGVKVFSATMVRDREVLGEKVTEWLREKQRAGAIEVTDYVVTQSSDESFHCVSITVFFVEGEQLQPQPAPRSASTPKNGKDGRRLSFSEPG